jgi:type IV pilus assembly protein PilA
VAADDIKELITKMVAKHNKQKGFSLIELLIVVAIILIIAAIAIPNLIRSKMAANESSAAGSVRSILTAQVMYSATYGLGYAPDLTTLGSPSLPCAATSTSACLLDAVLSTGTKSGYTLGTSTTNPVAEFVATAVPLGLDQTGSRSFCGDETMVVNYTPSASTVAADDVACQAFPSTLGQ